ncbi:MAG: T9SS type A sorting domain-containing protein [Leptolyngbya sp. SIO3F4]|nr:T9SS type A sorting domain-containing protein [Leptolyngbya sp. SIO3F4]
MKNTFTLLAALVICFASSAQSTYFERYILGTGGTISDTLDNGTVVVLDLSTDDVEQENDEVDSYYDDDLDTGWEGDPADQNILNLGLRFQNIVIEQGTTIDSAFIVFHAHEGKTAADVAMLTIVGDAADDAQTFDAGGGFTDMYLLTDRPQTTAQVDWTVAEDWVIWQPYKTADISSIVQELVNRPGWTSGNAMAFILLGEDQGPSVNENAREFTSFENIADPDDVDPNGVPGDGTNHPERRPYIQIYHQGTVGIAEVAQQTFRVYPNPVQDGFYTIELANSGEAQAILVNTAGEEVRSYTLNDMNNRLDMGTLPAGLYVVKVTQNGTSSTKKIVVK